ncbi:hypothetical protein B0T10DRAFT_390925, partial [Thelonectria olida]
LRELKNVGYTHGEIAELLLEEANDSVWICFTLDSRPDLEVPPFHHLEGCVHQLFLRRPFEDDATTGLSRPSPEHLDLEIVRIQIQRLCGLGGIAPSTREMDKWHGSVKFGGNSVALASCANLDTGIISRLVNVLKLFCTALAVAQGGKLCCESFTILRYRAWFEDEDARDPWVVEVSRVDFNLAVQLLAEVQAITDDTNLQTADLRAATKLVDDLFPGLYNRTVSTNAKPLEILHICSLAVQILTTGFESYIQAHEDPLQPCFLDGPIKKVKLLRISATTEQNPFVAATLKELTCMGEMLLKPVLVFSA